MDEYDEYASKLGRPIIARDALALADCNRTSYSPASMYFEHDTVQNDSITASSATDQM